MYNIVIVEDEIKIAETVLEYLKREGYSARHAVTVAEALQKITHETDLVVLDLMLPDGHGEDLCEKIIATYNTPVIMLTSKKTEQSRIHGFACGADDYLTKPFSPRELMARIKAVLKRVKPVNDTIKLGNNIVIYPARHMATKKDIDIRLTPNEYKILICLVNNSNTTVTRDKLIEFMSSGEAFDRTVDVHIRHLRQKIEDDPKNPQVVKTVHGYGYRLGVAKQDEKK